MPQKSAPKSKGPVKATAAKAKAKPSAKASAKAPVKAAAKASAKPAAGKPNGKPAAKSAAAAKPTASKAAAHKTSATAKPNPTEKELLKKGSPVKEPRRPQIEEPEELEMAEEVIEEIEENVAPVVASPEASALMDEPPSDDDIILTDAEGRRYCKVKDCDQYATVEDHCRFHYLLLWKRIQVRRKILVDGKLERYVEELTSRYPDKFLEMIRKDLRTEKDFLAAIAELEIDESAVDNEYEDENSSFIEEVRGMSSEGSLSDDDDF